MEDFSVEFSLSHLEIDTYASINIIHVQLDGECGRETHKGDANKYLLMIESMNMFKIC